MTETVQTTTSLETAFEVTKEVSETFIAGATEVFKSLGENWAQNVTPLEQRWQNIVDANASLFQKGQRKGQRAKGARLVSKAKGARLERPKGPEKPKERNQSKPK